MSENIFYGKTIRSWEGRLYRYTSPTSKWYDKEFVQWINKTFPDRRVEHNPNKREEQFWRWVNTHYFIKHDGSKLHFLPKDTVLDKEQQSHAVWMLGRMKSSKEFCKKLTKFGLKKYKTLQLEDTAEQLLQFFKLNKRTPMKGGPNGENKLYEFWLSVRSGDVSRLTLKLKREVLSLPSRDDQTLQKAKDVIAYMDSTGHVPERRSKSKKVQRLRAILENYRTNGSACLPKKIKDRLDSIETPRMGAYKKALEVLEYFKKNKVAPTRTHKDYNIKMLGIFLGSIRNGQGASLPKKIRLKLLTLPVNFKKRAVPGIYKTIGGKPYVRIAKTYLGVFNTEEDAFAAIKRFKEQRRQDNETASERNQTRSTPKRPEAQTVVA